MPGTFAETASTNARSRVFTWVLSGTDAVNGDPTPALGHYRDRTIQCFGTFNSAGITIQGSNDPRVVTDPNNAVWAGVVDTLGNAITFTAAGMKTILDAPLYLRAIMDDAGDGSTAVTIILAASGGEH